MAAISNLDISTATFGQMLDKLNDGIERLDTLSHDDNEFDVSQGNVITLNVSGSANLNGSEAVSNSYLQITLGDYAANSFLTANYVANADYTAADVLAKLLTVDGDGSNLDADLLDGNQSGHFTSNVFVTSNYVANVDYTAADVLAKLVTVDGAGSGLNADQLDGFEAGFFVSNTTFQSHGHPISDITNLQSSLDDKAPLDSPSLTGTPTAPTASTGANTTQIATTAFVQGEVSQGIPSGAIMDFAMNSPPDGWLECDGSAVSRTTYADLFSAISTTWGNGDGSTTFNVPDFRGEFRRGWDNGRGIDSGRSFASFQADEFESHTHDFTAAIESGDELSENNVEPQDTGISETTDSTTATGGSETRPRNYAVLSCIKH